MRHAARVLRRSPWFAVSAAATLALGIGVATAIFSVSAVFLAIGAMASWLPAARAANLDPVEALRQE